MEKLTIEQLAPEHLIPYISFGLKVQYEGILNGKELSEYKKKYKKICGNDIFPNYSDAEIIEQIGEMPKETIGLKVGRIRIIEFCKHFTKYRIGGKGMQTHYNTLKFKPILHDLSSLTKEIIHEGYNNNEPFVPIDELEIDGCNISVYDGSIRLSTTEDCEFIYAMDVYNQIVQQLIKWHFNVFNIPSHLFIDKLNLK